MSSKEDIDMENGIPFHFDVIGRDELGNRLFHNHGVDRAPSLWAGLESKYEEVFGEVIPEKALKRVEETPNSYTIVEFQVEISVQLDLEGRIIF